MKKLILLLGLLITLPISAQSIFSGGHQWTDTPYKSETVFTNVNFNGDVESVAIEKVYRENGFTYNVTFFGGEDYINAGSGTITINSFEIFEGKNQYSVVVNYTKTSIYYVKKTDKWGDDYQIPNYESNDGVVMFDRNKYGVK